MIQQNYGKKRKAWLILYKRGRKRQKIYYCRKLLIALQIQVSIYELGKLILSK